MELLVQVCPSYVHHLRIVKFQTIHNKVYAKGKVSDVGKAYFDDIWNVIGDSLKGGNEKHEDCGMHEVEGSNSLVLLSSPFLAQAFSLPSFHLVCSI